MILEELKKKAIEECEHVLGVPMLKYTTVMNLIEAAYATGFNDGMAKGTVGWDYNDGINDLVNILKSKCQDSVYQDIGLYTIIQEAGKLKSK